MSIYVAIPISNKVPREPLGNIHYFEQLDGDTAAKKYNRIIEEFLATSSDDWLCIHHHDLELRCPEPEIQRQLDMVYPLGVRTCGVIGTMCLYRSFQWWQPMRPAVTAGAIVQGYANGTEQPMLDQPGIRTDMASVDGCVMWLHRDILASGLRVDENIPGWHCYDVDLSLGTLARGFKVGVLNVAAMHKSEGEFDPAVFEQCRKYMDDKWTKVVDFPVVSGVTKWTR